MNIYCSINGIIKCIFWLCDEMLCVKYYNLCEAHMVTFLQLV